MKIITLHSNWIDIEPKKKALKEAEKTKGKLRFKECLVVLTAVEKADESSPESVAQNTIEAIKKIAGEVKTNKIVLYPYVHLTATPASPKEAQKTISLIEQGLKKEKFDVSHAPFGWYKAFTISVKGHPLAELSREITAQPGTARIEEELSGALKEEEKVKSEWFILTPEGKMVKAENFDFKEYPNLKKFFRYEYQKVRGVPAEPPHAKLMRALQLADYEPGSDPGNLRWYPKGRLIKSLLERWVTERTIEYGAMELETPVMFDYEHPALKSYLHRFPARQYIVRSAKKEFFLRFSACFGQFLTMASATLSYRDLPAKIYELTRYSFRLEKAGELSALRRLRAFTMPDLHAICKDIEQAKEEFINQFKLCMNLMKDLGLEPGDYETGIRFTKDFYKNNKDFPLKLVKIVNRPALIEIWDRRYAYFDPKFEFNFIDSMDKAAALSTVQIDHENAKRFNILFTDADNKRKYPLITHCSPSGAIERVIYALLEKAHMQIEQKKNPIFPLWLSPTQVRLCPVNDSFINYAVKIANELSAQKIRVDVDDRPETIQKKIRDAEKEWIPFIVVIGDKEKRSGKLAVRIRQTGKIENWSKVELAEKINEKTKGFPYKRLPLPKLLSKRPAFL